MDQSKFKFEKTFGITNSPFRPRRWKGKIISENSKITITNLDPIKRPIIAVADNNEVRQAKRISVKVNKRIKFNLLYDRNRSLKNKIKLEQLRKKHIEYNNFNKKIFKKIYKNFISLIFLHFIKNRFYQKKLDISEFSKRK